mgnify:CR=1 FL=1
MMIGRVIVSNDARFFPSLAKQKGDQLRTIDRTEVGDKQAASLLLDKSLKKAIQGGPQGTMLIFSSHEILHLQHPGGAGDPASRGNRPAGALLGVRDKKMTPLLRLLGALEPFQRQGQTLGLICQPGTKKGGGANALLGSGGFKDQWEHKNL